LRTSYCSTGSHSISDPEIDTTAQQFFSDLWKTMENIARAKYSQLRSEIRHLKLTKTHSGQFITISHNLKLGNLIIITSHGRISKEREPGSARGEIWVLFGCSMPIILPSENGQYLVVDPAYIGGLMFGEAVEGIPDNFQDGEGYWTMGSVQLHWPELG
jgi:hypothetical protein